LKVGYILFALSLLNDDNDDNRFQKLRLQSTGLFITKQS
jgi:hypothetical protein